MSRSAAAVLAGNGWMQPISPTFSADMCWRQPFTASQWRELEHQALIFKYLLAGVPVPPDLLIPIQKSFESLPSGFFHHIPSNSSPLGIFSYYGKKIDPEPGRCRRTDGKKWRCSKDAHTDSKYCERHMHRSRNRSRKHVESNNNPSQLDSESQITFPSTRTSHVSSRNTGSFQNNTMPFAVPCASKPQGLCSGSSGSSSLQFGSQDYEISSKGYLHESTKIDVDMHNLFSRYPSSIQTGLKTSQAPSFPISKEKTNHLYGNYSSQLQSIQDLNEGTISSTVNKQDQHYPYFKSDFALPVLTTQNCQCLHPVFNEWPKVKELWPGLDEEHSKKSSFSVTQLSMSIPMTSSDFSTTSCSPNGDN